MNCTKCGRDEKEAGPLSMKAGTCLQCDMDADADAPGTFGARVAEDMRKDAREAVIRAGDGDIIAVHQPLEPLQLIDRAISRGIDADELGKLIDLQRGWKADQAAEAFAVAVSGFQADCGPVLKSRTANLPKFSYTYASFDDVMAVARPFLKKWGIALSFDTDNGTDSKKLIVRCKVRVGTHTDTTTVTLPIPPTAGAMVNDTQLFAQAVSYGKRYALCAALNIVVTDEDTDAGSLDRITEEEAMDIERVIRKCGIRLDKFIGWADPSVPAGENGYGYADLRLINARALPRIKDDLGRREREHDQKKGNGAT